MINRLTAFIDQINKISTNNILIFYNEDVISCDNEQLLHGITNISNDTKSKGFFSNRIFYINTGEYKEYLKTYKKSFDKIQFNDKDIIIKSSIPDSDLIFKWNEDIESKFKEYLSFYNKAKKINESNYIFKSESNDNEKLLSTNRVYLNFNNESIEFEKPDGNFISLDLIIKKYVGKITKTSKVIIYLYETEEENKYIVRFNVTNSKLVSDYYGMIIDYI